MNTRNTTALSKPAKSPAILPEIRTLIEASRERAVGFANLTLIARNWHIGRVITEDVQRHAKRANYGEQLLAQLAQFLAREYGDGFSQTTLQEMRRFHESFEIYSAVPNKFAGANFPQALPVEASATRIYSAVPNKSGLAKIRQAVPVESSARCCREKRRLVNRLKLYSRAL